MRTPKNLIGPNVRKIRVERGLSQAALAAILQRRGWDISRGVLASIEGQVRWIADFELIFLCNALAVSLEQLASPSKMSKKAATMVRELHHGGKSE
jgi:transcriptional regulator with XRE-family HTH domain